MKYITHILVLLILLFTSCKKSEIIAEEETKTAQQLLQIDDTEDEISYIADACMNDGSGFRTGEQDQILSGCATVTKDTLGLNHYKVTVDFGPVNCSSIGVKQRRGKVLIDIIGNYKDSGSVRTVTFDNFYRNDNKIDGTRIITNAGKNSSGYWEWVVQAKDMKITRTDASYHTWNSTRIRTMTKGYTTPTRQDDEYQITGFASGENSDGVSFTANITTPLIRRMSCDWIVSGILEITNSKGETRLLNYGTGNCDFEAVIEVTGKRGKIFTKTIIID